MCNIKKICKNLQYVTADSASENPFNGNDRHKRASSNVHLPVSAFASSFCTPDGRYWQKDQEYVLTRSLNRLMAPGRKARAINSGDSGNPAGGRRLPMGGIHSLYCTVLYSSPGSCLDAYDAVAPNILAALHDTTSGRITARRASSRLVLRSKLSFCLRNDGSIASNA